MKILNGIPVFKQRAVSAGMRLPPLDEKPSEIIEKHQKQCSININVSADTFIFAPQLKLQKVNQSEIASKSLKKKRKGLRKIKIANKQRVNRYLSLANFA